MSWPNMKTFTQISPLHDWTYERPLLACRLDPQGRFVVTSAENSLLQRFMIPDGAMQTFPVAHDSWVQALALSSDGNLCVSGGGDGRLVWWDTSGTAVKPIRTVDVHAKWIRGISISSDNRYLISGGYDALVKLWDLQTGQLVRTFVGHEMNVYSVQFFPDNQRFVSGDLKGVVYLWNVSQEQSLAKLDAAPLHSFNDGQKVNFGGVRSLAVNSNMTEIVAGGLHKATNPLGAVHEPFALRFSLADHALKNSHSAEGIPGGSLWRVQYVNDNVVIGVCGGSTVAFLLQWQTSQDAAGAKIKLPSLARDMDISDDRALVATAHHDRHVRISRNE